MLFPSFELNISFLVTVHGLYRILAVDFDYSAESMRLDEIKTIS
jgi:hypothetical protein